MPILVVCVKRLETGPVFEKGVKGLREVLKQERDLIHEIKHTEANSFGVSKHPSWD